MRKSNIFILVADSESKISKMTASDDEDFLVEEDEGSSDSDNDDPTQVKINIMILRGKNIINKHMFIKMVPIAPAVR